MQGSRTDRSPARHRMVREQIEARGLRSPRVLRAIETVRREGFVPEYLGEFAYDDTPLPIEAEQTISQPYIVAFMLQALELTGDERVLEVGTGSGYAAAVLAELAGEVFTIERHARLADRARERLVAEGCADVHVRCGDGTLGWPEAAPFDAIVVAAGAPEVPSALERQLAVGGRLVIPVGGEVGLQKLLRVTRTAADEFHREELADVRFVPLVGASGWQGQAGGAPGGAPSPSLERCVAAAMEPFDSIAGADLGPLLDRIGDARVVLLGEATHGSAEFHRMRARITRELVERRGFRLVAVEADWPDAARVDRHVRGGDLPIGAWQAFARFPVWMWRNRQIREFVDELRVVNDARPDSQRVRFAGLDLYSLHTSIDAVLRYLDDADAAAAKIARQRYGCLTPFQSDPVEYGRAALDGAYRSCERDVVAMLDDLLRRRMELTRRDDEAWFDAIQNARLVADAEQYYRVMYYGAHRAWNLRDQHMFDTLQELLRFAGPDSKAVVWAHNSHLGNAAATEMAARGEFNLGQLCREHYGDACYAIGFGTDRGTVAAASHWGGPMEIKDVLPAREDSYEGVCHAAGVPMGTLALRRPRDSTLRERLARPRLQRAIGVVYRPETERASHYFEAVLPEQFDEWMWFDWTGAVQPIESHELAGDPETYPFGT